MIDGILNFLTHPATFTFAAFTVGWILRGKWEYMKWGEPKDRIERLEDVMLRDLTVDTALGYLTEEEIEDLEDRVQARLENNGFEDVTFEVEEVGDRGGR